MDESGLDRARFPPAASGGDGPIAELAEREPLGNSLGNITAWRAAVELEEGDDVNARGQLEESLLEPQEEVIDLGRLGLGLLARDLADGHEVLPTVVAEDEAIAAIAFLEAGHGCPQCHDNPVANMLPIRLPAQEKGVTPNRRNPLP